MARGNTGGANTKKTKKASGNGKPKSTGRQKKSQQENNESSLRQNMDDASSKKDKKGTSHTQKDGGVSTKHEKQIMDDASSGEDEKDTSHTQKDGGVSRKKDASHKEIKRVNIRSTNSSKQGSSSVLLLAVAVLAVAVAVGVYVFLDWNYFSFPASFTTSLPVLYWNYFCDFITASTNSGFCNPHRNDTCDKLLQQNFLNLGRKYSDQSSNTWLTLYSAALDHVSYQPNPQRPVVIMVYRLKNSSAVNETLEDIAGVYGSTLPPNKKNYGNILIDGKSFTNSDPEETQKQIQNMLENGFETEAQKVAIVHDFDKLPSCSVLAFHNYCNNDDAPHKNVAIILTVTAGEEKLSPDPKAPELEKAVGKLLHEKWKDCPKELPPGKIDAMLSRVANNVILLR